ncbi:hypothetical protein E2493_15010 [Sphingomonas parva]|uniref:Uncharacterized protein n=2 Tax=Sphingomonas parva TaxID=2555898 RepID=A0A4Y8ZNE3_9SPHN|nr:hypothetical protein E2493_15010 [Sphingomonas parva]
MTDIFTGALAAFAGPELVIEYPVEAETGGDIDLRFWHVETSRELHLRIQAKRLNAMFNGKTMTKVAHRSYHELLHKPHTSVDYQFKTLVDAPDPWVPLYMFYNHQSVVEDPYFASGGPTVSGVNLAFATDIAGEMQAKLDAATATPKSVKHHKRLSHLRKHLFGLDALLCPAGDWGGAGVPPPGAVSEALRASWGARGQGSARTKDEDVILRILSEPDTLSPDRRPGRRISDGPPVRVDRSLERPVVTFISGRTDDDRTPSIAEDVRERRR